MTGHCVCFCSIMFFILQTLYFILFLYHFQHLVHSEYFIARPPVAGKRHEFNKPNMYRLMFWPFYKISKLIVVQSFHHDHIHLYMKIPFQQKLNILIYLFELISSCDELKLFRLQCIQTNIK